MGRRAIYALVFAGALLLLCACGGGGGGDRGSSNWNEMVWNEDVWGP